MSQSTDPLQPPYPPPVREPQNTWNGQLHAFLTRVLRITASVISGGIFNLNDTDGDEPGEIRWFEKPSNGTDYVAFKAPDDLLNVTTTYTLPLADATIPTSSLRSDANGVLYWSNVGFSPTTFSGLTDTNFTSLSNNDWAMYDSATLKWLNISPDATFTVAAGSLSITADSLKDSFIDWGSGADQVDANSVPYEDASDLSPGGCTDVDACLDEMYETGAGSRVQTVAFRTFHATGAGSFRRGVIDTTSTDARLEVPSGKTMYLLSVHGSITTGATAGTYDISIGVFDFTAGAFVEGVNATTTATSSRRDIQDDTGTISSPLLTVASGRNWMPCYQNNGSSPGALGSNNHYIVLTFVYA